MVVLPPLNVRRHIPIILSDFHFFTKDFKESHVIKKNSWIFREVASFYPGASYHSRWCKCASPHHLLYWGRYWKECKLVWLFLLKWWGVSKHWYGGPHQLNWKYQEWRLHNQTCSSPRRPLFLHALSFECTSNLCVTFLNQFLVFFHI